MIVKTYSGRRFNLMEFKTSDVDIFDIAHHLANCNRWAGGTKHAFSVAQHSILVSQLLPREKRLRGLLHDASDYLLGDLMSPIKHDPRMRFFVELEHAIQDVIYEAFGCAKGQDDDVKIADLTIQAMEARDLMGTHPSEFHLPTDLPPAPLVPWPPVLAEKRFLETFDQFSRENFVLGNPIAHTKGA